MAFDLEKFNSQVYTVATELVDQEVEKFNQASDGTILLSPSNGNVGDFSMEASFKLISNIVRRRDVMNGTNSVSAVRLVHVKDTGVKVAAGTPPINFERAQYAWIKQDSASASYVIGQQLAKAMLQDELNSAVRCLASAIGNNAAVTNDISASGTATHTALADTTAKFGDRMSDIRAWVLHSKVYADLLKAGLANNEHLFNYGTVNIMRDFQGRVFVVTDSPALVNTSKYTTLGLVQSAALVEPNNDFYAILDEVTGSENIQSSYQAEWSYNIGLLGYGWDTAAGGAAPSDTALGTGTNWVKNATSDKDTAGVALISK